MVELEWPRRSTFRDRERNEEYVGPGTFDVEEEAVESYMSQGWRQTDASDDDEENEATTRSDVEKYPQDVLESKDWGELRSLAADSTHPDVNGGSSRSDIIEALSE